MKAILLAAGFGTRLKPLTETIPKCLVPIRGYPLLGIWLDLFAASTVDKILINTHYLHHLVENYINNHPLQSSITLSYEPILLGTAGTVLKNKGWIGNDAVILAHADNLTRFNVDQFIQTHENRPIGIEITMMTFTTDTPHSCGIVECDQNIVIDFHEKVANPPGNLANGAVYILEPTVISFLASIGKSVIDFSTEVLPHYLKKIQIYHNDDYHRDIGTPLSLSIAESDY